MQVWAMILIRQIPGLWRPLLPLFVSAILLTLALAPVHQFYLAWVGLVPWLVFVHSCRSQRAAFLWSWVAGTIFFTANMWWMGYISIAGMIALMIYCGLYWGFAAIVIRGARLLSRGTAGVFAIAAVWVAFEWLRGNLITGLPWLFLGHTQSPILVMCQISDITGAYGVSFWVAAMNALIAIGWLQRKDLRPLWPAASAVGGLIVVFLCYGIFRINQTPAHLSPGPMLAVIQANFPQSNTGAKGASLDELLEFHENETNRAIAAYPGKIDLAVWSETVMAPLNPEAVAEYEGLPALVRRLSELTAKNHLALLTGGEYMAKFANVVRDGKPDRIPTEKRNTAYFFDQSGQLSDKRYDKIHLVPWGEFIPFKGSIPWLYDIFIYLGPPYYADYNLESGDADAMTVFDLGSTDNNHPWRFVSPICFEDIDSTICARMFRPRDGSGKRADFLVNITNDGWFKANENAQHFQAAIFRSIENRAPTARSVNTGISGFIDSTGQANHLLAVRTAGSSVAQLMIDDRMTFFTRYGDLFAFLCLAATGTIALASWSRRPRKRGRSAKDRGEETKSGKPNVPL
jgi:apolipoprotein N-acyltransferase